MGWLGKLVGAFRQEAPQVLPGRNEECWCGSGRKYKQCHLDRDRELAQARAKSPCGPV